MVLTTKDGQKKPVEIIVSFKVDEFDSEYVIYKVDNEFYGAKYINKDNCAELITNLNNKEKKIINDFYLKFKKEGVIDA